MADRLNVNTVLPPDCVQYMLVAPPEVTGTIPEKRYDAIVYVSVDTPGTQMMALVLATPLESYMVPWDENPTEILRAHTHT